MLDLFDPPHRRVKDEREVRYFYTKYKEKAPEVLSERANDDSLSPRDRRHWRRLARKARRQHRKWMDRLNDD
jgi:hypothetical protein|tara:strand:- start:28498 stop:28713 length:216 start_codon:yes stop_codon:yes gene_type:complete